jgi:hypothetical protein
MTMHRSIAPWLGAALLLAASPVRAETDLQTWLEAGVGRRLAKRVDLSFEGHLRFDQDVSRLQAVMPELGLSYRLHKALRLGLGYRFIYERDKNGVMAIRHRLQAEARPRFELGPVEVSYRLRYQGQIRDAIADGLRHTLRNRLQVALGALRPWTPAIAAETFHRLGDGEGIRLRKLRLTAGVGYQLGDHEIGLFYRVEILQEDPRDPIPHILGLAYEYEL